MFLPTKNPYKFQYLITGITGDGIKEVYLPAQPKPKEVLFKKEQKFTRAVIPEYLQDWMDDMCAEREKNQDYIHPHQDEINEWEDREFQRCTDGIFFWNNKVITYITGDHYKYLTQWELYFGFPNYRETDKETFYWMKFWEEDPASYGGTYNTCRREGKSSKMGFWLMNRCSTHFKHFGGSQGEDDLKIRDFYDVMVMNPFYNLPYYSQPTYDTNTLQKKGIIFNEPPKRNKRRTRKLLVLGSKIDYRTSAANMYDQAALHSYAMEEAGKLLKVSVKERWKFVKPCLKNGIIIRGKAFLGTTVEFMDVATKGGRAYEKLCYESDYDIRQANGQTMSGLYAALMPADCVLEGFIDEHGHPMRAQAMKWILDERKSVEDNPKDYSDLVRKYPTSWKEVFYISADKCEFNSKILQDRKFELQINPPQLRRVDLRWENNVRFSKIIMYDNAATGWLKLSWVPKTEQELSWLNNVGMKFENGKKKYFPKNDNIFQCGTDPIDHGVRVEAAVVGDQVINSRRSRPVLLLKRKYDSSIDGVLTPELMIDRAKQKYPYKTNKHYGLMDHRPNDPNVYFERALMICWLFSMSIHCESQKPGLINWFNNGDGLGTITCEDFIQNKYVPILENAKPAEATIDGTPASPMMIQEYTSAIATDVEYFGHTYPFIEIVEDDLVFDPTETRKYDYTVAQGWCELAGKNKPRTQPPPTRTIEEYFHRYDRDGFVIR